MRFPTSLIPSVVLLALAAAPARGQSADAVRYQLEDHGSYADGCFGPCECPVREFPMKGEFILKRLTPDPLFQHFAVSDVKWRVQLPDRQMDIVGSGTYRVGGEVAVTQQMTLDLALAGGPVQHFDSGLVTSGSAFPLIDIKVSLHGVAQCVDTVLHVVAAPAVAEVFGQEVATGLKTVVPNPSHAGVEVDLVLARAGPASVVIHDAQGRAVRTLVRDAWLEAGVHRLRWDGRSERGGLVPAGTWFVIAELDGREYRRSFVTLR